MDTFSALEQTTRSRIERHHQQTQLKRSILTCVQRLLSFSFIRTALSAKFKLALTLMLVTSFWFGWQAWSNQVAIHASNALSFNSERYLIAAVIMGCICWRVRARFTKRAVVGGGVTGFAFALMMTFESQSLVLGSAERVAFLSSLFVILMPFLGRLFRGQKLYPAAVGGSVIVIVGTWCLFGVANGHWGGDFFALLRAGACAGMLLAIQYFAGEDWRVSSFINLSVVALFSIAGAGLTGQLQMSLQPTVLLPAALSAVMGSVVGGSVLIWSGRYLSSALSGVLMFLEAPFTLLWGIFLAGSTLTPASLSAYTLIGVGTICVLMAGAVQLPPLKLRFTRREAHSANENALAIRAISE